MVTTQIVVSGSFCVFGGRVDAKVPKDNSKVMRRYSYVGEKAIADSIPKISSGTHIRKLNDLLGWLTANSNPRNRKAEVTATYIIDLAGELWLADQHSEHVACAGGQDVLAAGEIVITRDGNSVLVSEVSNQSTGYCPEPSCWYTVVTALDKLPIAHPPTLTSIYLFRRCNVCGSTNIVKDDWFECAVCHSPLSHEWNFA